MSWEIWHRDEIESPCVNLCVMHPRAGICAGCYRTLDEITQWGAMTPEFRTRVIGELAERKNLLKKRRGGRVRPSAEGQEPA